MSRCIRCSKEVELKGSRICISCNSAWADMRTEVYNTLLKKHGVMTFENHDIFIKETRRLERIWGKDKDKFKEELSNI